MHEDDTIPAWSSGKLRQAWDGARNPLADKVSLPVEITAGRDRADASYIRVLCDENPES